MTDALAKYKALVDQLRELPAGASETMISEIDTQLQSAWEALSETDRSEAEAYWRGSTVCPVASSHSVN